MTKNARKVADQLIFIENGKLKKLCHLPLTPVEILLSFWQISKSKKLFCFNVIASRAKLVFENLKKNCTEKGRNLMNSKKSGTSREAVKKAKSELQQWNFLIWIDDFVQPQSSFHVDYSQQSQQSQQTIEKNSNFLDNEDDFKKDNENDEFDKPEGNFQMSQAIRKDAVSEWQETVNVQAKLKQLIAKKKLDAMKESQMEQQKLTFLRCLNERMESRDKRKLMMLKIDVWLQ